MKKTTAKSDIQVILGDFVGRRKVAVIADEILSAMQAESQHMHDGSVFYVYKDEMGDLVLTMESFVKVRIEKILRKYLEEGDVQECLEALTEKQMAGDESVDNAKTLPFETIKVEGSNSKIYASLMKHEEESYDEVKFKHNLKKAIFDSVPDFEVFACDPSIDEKGKLQFLPGFKPAAGYSHNELVNLANENGLRLGSKSEYILFLATMILRLIAEGWSEEEAWKSICHDSKKLGHYKNSANARPELEPTGSRKTAGKCDLANTCKILARDEKARGFWLAGGNYNDYSVDGPIANLDFDDDYGYRYAGCVGWFVL